jgi:hypothetical protein
MVTWTFTPGATDAAIARFQETGAMPPDGVTMVFRCHDVAGGRGFALAESEDIVPIGRWCRQWTDLLAFEVIPVVDDEQMVAVLSEQS